MSTTDLCFCELQRLLFAGILNGINPYVSCAIIRVRIINRLNNLNRVDLYSPITERKLDHETKKHKQLPKALWCFIIGIGLGTWHKQ